METRNEVQAVIFKEDFGKRKYLLIEKYAKSKGRYEWRLVKGGIENGETEEQALKREIEEEVGLKDVQILEKIHNYSFDFRIKHHLVTTFLVKANPDLKVNIKMSNSYEIITDFKWVTANQAVRMLTFEEERITLRGLK